MPDPINLDEYARRRALEHRGAGVPQPLITDSPSTPTSDHKTQLSSRARVDSEGRSSGRMMEQHVRPVLYAPLYHSEGDAPLSDAEHAAQQITNEDGWVTHSPEGEKLEVPYAPGLRFRARPRRQVRPPDEQGSEDTVRFATDRAARRARRYDLAEDRADLELPFSLLAPGYEDHLLVAVVTERGRDFLHRYYDDADYDERGILILPPRARSAFYDLVWLAGLRITRT